MGVVFGTNGYDTIDSTTNPELLDVGANAIFAYGGNDKVTGTDDVDVVYGGTGNDKVWGQGGSDVIYGEAGDDKLYGGGGRDQVDGGEGNDVVNGDNGNDYLAGGAGNDTVRGDEGDDSLGGGEGVDVVNGGKGNDEVISALDGAKDLFTGGAGADVFRWIPGGSASGDTDTITDFKDGVDTIDLQSFGIGISAVKAVTNVSAGGTDISVNLDADSAIELKIFLTNVFANNVTVGAPGSGADIIV